MEVDRGIKVGEDLKKEPQTHKQQACTLGLIAQVIFAFCNVLHGRSRRGHQFVSRLKKHSPRNYNRADRLVSEISHNAGGERRTVGVQHEDDHPQNNEMAQHHGWPAGYDAKKQPRKKHGPHLSTIRSPKLPTRSWPGRKSRTIIGEAPTEKGSLAEESSKRTTTATASSLRLRDRLRYKERAQTAC